MERKTAEKGDFMDENNRVKFSRLRYNLEDLFENPPVFDAPLINYQNETENDEENVETSTVNGKLKISCFPNCTYFDRLL